MRKAQSTLELTLSFVVIIMLLVGMFRVFTWVVKNIVGQDKTYTTIMQNPAGGAQDEYTPEKINLVP